MFQTQFKQREYDGKWMKLEALSDYDNAYSFKNEDGNFEKFIPVQWVVTGVYDTMVEFS